MDDTVLAFRNSMAEEGYEYMPSHAADVLETMDNLKEEVHENARIDPERYEHMANLTPEEKRKICKQYGFTAKDLDEAIEIILMVYEQERLF